MHSDERLFSRLFDGLDLSSLSWVENGRRSLREKYGQGPDG